MLSYQHAFHCGSWCDVIKHIVFCLILQHLNKKDTPYCVIDTHSGAGLYDLNDPRLLKTKEADTGIKKLLSIASPPPIDLPLQTQKILECYLQIEKKYFAKNLYAGSPFLALNFIRKQDKLVLLELHPQEISALQQNIKKIKGKNVTVHYKNGFQMLPKLVPPMQNRGVVLIDPSYETQSDWDMVASSLQQALKKWHNGIYAIWYPMLEHKKDALSTMKQRLYNIALKYTPHSPPLDIQFLRAPSPATISRLYGTGMFIINPCYTLQAQPASLLPSLIDKII